MHDFSNKERIINLLGMAKTWLRDERREIAILVISSLLLISLSFLMALIREHEGEQVVETRFDLETIERLKSQR